MKKPINPMQPATRQTLPAARPGTHAGTTARATTTRRRRFTIGVVIAAVVLVLGVGAALAIQRTSSTSSSAAIGNFQRVATTAVVPTRPVPVFFLSALYCPYCAAERWALVDSLGRFRDWSNLNPSHSTSGVDGLTEIPTYDLLHASYHSRYVACVHRDVADAQGNPLELLRPDEKARVNRFDPRGGIPFLLINGAFAQGGSGFSPSLLAGKSFQQVRAELASDAPAGRAIHREGDVVTALICYADGGQPEAVCGEPAVDSLLRSLK